MRRKGETADSSTTEEMAATTSGTQPAAVSEPNIEETSRPDSAGDAQDEGARSSEQDTVSPPALPPSSDSDADLASSAPPDEEPPPPPPVVAKPVSVMVMVDNLGPQLLQKGDITSDPKIVKLLDDGSGRVMPVELAD